MDEVGEVDFDLSEWTVLDDDDGSVNEAANSSVTENKDKEGKSYTLSSASKTHTAVKKAELQKGSAKSETSKPTKSKTENSKPKNSSPKPAASGKQPDKATNTSSSDNQVFKTAVKTVGQDDSKAKASTSQPKTPSKADTKAGAGSSVQTKSNAKSATLQKTNIAVTSTPSPSKATKLVLLDSDMDTLVKSSITATDKISQKPDIKTTEPKMISGTSGNIKPDISKSEREASISADLVASTQTGVKSIDAGFASNSSSVISSKTEITDLKGSKATPDSSVVTCSTTANTSKAIIDPKTSKLTTPPSTKTNVTTIDTGMTMNKSNASSSKTVMRPKVSKGTPAVFVSASPTSSSDSATKVSTTKASPVDTGLTANTSNVSSSKKLMDEPKALKGTPTSSSDSVSKLNPTKASPSKQKTDNVSGTKAQPKPSGTPSSVNESKSVNTSSKPISQPKTNTPKLTKVNTVATSVTKLPSKASDPTCTSGSNISGQTTEDIQQTQPTSSAQKSSIPLKAANIDSESLAAVMMSVEKTNSLSVTIASSLDGKNVIKKSDVACGTKRAMTTSLPEPVTKKVKLDDPVSCDIPSVTKKESALPVSLPAPKQTSDKKSEMNKSLVENPVSTLSNELSVKTPAKRIIRRFHRSTQTVTNQSESKVLQCDQLASKTVRPDVDACIQVGTQYKPNWQDEVRYIKSLPESVMPDVFKIISEFNVNKPNERNTVTGTFKYGVSLGHVAVTNLMKSPFKETFLLKADNFNMFFTGPEVGVIDLFLNDEEKFTNLLTQIRKTRIGPRHLVVTVSMNLDEGERDPTCPLTNVKGTIVFDQNFSTSSFILQSKAPVWNRPKPEETVSFHNIPGGVPVDFLKVLVPDAITIDLDDPESKFTLSGSRVVMSFARKSGDRTLKLFSQMYINNEFVPCTLGATKASEVPELEEIEKVKQNWLVETKEKFPNSRLNSKEIDAVSRDINEGKLIQAAVEKEITVQPPAMTEAEKILTVPDIKPDSNSEMETAVSAALSDISDTSDIGNEPSAQKPIPKVKAVLKKNSTKKHLESLKSTLKTLSKTTSRPHRSLPVAKDTKVSKISRTNKDGHSSRSQKDNGKTSKTRSEKKKVTDSSISRARKLSDRGNERSPRIPRSSEGTSRNRDVAQDSSRSRDKNRSQRIQDKLRQMRRGKDKLDKIRSPVKERHPRVESSKSKHSRERSDDRSLGRSRARHPHEESKWPRLDREGSRHSGRAEVPYDRGIAQAGDSTRVYRDSSLDRLPSRPELMNREDRRRAWSRSPVRQFVRGRSASPRRSPPHRISDSLGAFSPASNLRRVIIRKSLSPVQDPLFLRRLGQNHSLPRERQSDIRDYSHALSPISVGDDMEISGPLGSVGPQGGVWLPQPPVLSDASTSRSQIQTVSGRVIKDGDLRKTLSMTPGMKNLVSVSAERSRQSDLLSQAALKQHKNLSDSRDLLAKLVEHMKAASSSQQADSNLSKTIDVSTQFLERIKALKPPQPEHRAPPQSDYRAPPQSEYRPPSQHEHRQPSQSEHRAPPQSDYRAPPQSDYRVPPQSDFRAPPQHEHRPPSQPEHRAPPPGHGARNVANDMRAKPFETFPPPNQGNPPARPQSNFPAYGNNNPALSRFPGPQQPPSTVLSGTGMRLPPPIPPPVMPPLYGTTISAQDRMSQLEALANQLASDIQKHQQQPGGQSGGGQPRWNTPQPANTLQMQGQPMTPPPAMNNISMNNIFGMIQSQRMGTPQMNQPVRPNLDQSNVRGMNANWPSGNFF